MDELEISDFPELPPTFRLTYRPQSRQGTSMRQAGRNAVTYFSTALSRVFESTEDETIADEETTRRNQERLHQQFAIMHEQLDRQDRNIRNAMRRMSKREQEEVIAFWTVARGWMINVWTWLKSVFDRVLEKIKQGYRIAKSALKEAFDWVLEALQKLF